MRGERRGEGRSWEGRGEEREGRDRRVKCLLYFKTEDLIWISRIHEQAGGMVVRAWNLALGGRDSWVWGLLTSHSS